MLPAMMGCALIEQIRSLVFDSHVFLQTSFSLLTGRKPQEGQEGGPEGQHPSDGDGEDPLHPEQLPAVSAHEGRGAGGSCRAD